MHESSSKEMCDHADSLISYLYGEIGAVEARDFEEHLSACQQCSREVALFRDVRSSIAEWRDQAALPAVVPQDGRLPAHVDAVGQSSGQRSAKVAFREFFSLSPFWLRGATAMATIVFLAITVLALSSILQVDSNRIAPNRESAFPVPSSGSVELSPKEKAYSQSEVDELIARRLQEEREMLLRQAEEQLSIKAAQASQNASRESRRAQPARRATPETEQKDDDLPGLYDLLTVARTEQNP